MAASGEVENSTQDLPSASGSSCVTDGVGIRTRKRKSRWDNPMEETPHSRSRIIHSEGDDNYEWRKERFCNDAISKDLRYILI